MQIESNGTGNQIVVPDDVPGRLTINGDGNVVIIGAPTSAVNVNLQIDGSNSVLQIGTGCSLGHLTVYQRSGTSVRIGERVGFNGLIRLLLHEPASLSIGNDCLFAGGTDMTVSDMHSIFDVQSRERLNPARSITVHDHCWLGQNTMVLKGAEIGRNAVIGACSVVTGQVPGQCIAVGVPAKVIRRGVFWTRALNLEDSASGPEAVYVPDHLEAAALDAGSLNHFGDHRVSAFRRLLARVRGQR